MSTHVPGFESFFRCFASFCIRQISHQQQKGLLYWWSAIPKPFSLTTHTLLKIMTLAESDQSFQNFVSLSITYARLFKIFTIKASENARMFFQN